MSSQSPRTTAALPTTNPEPVPGTKKRRAKRTYGPPGWVTLEAGTRMMYTNRHAFLRMVELEQVRTRLLPGETHAKYFAEDLERIQREAIQAGLPQPMLETKQANSV